MDFPSFYRAPLFCALLAACGPSCNEKGAEKDKEAHPEKDPGVDVVLGEKALASAALKIERAKSSPTRSSISASGTIDFMPSRVARVGPSISGRIGEVLVTVGQRVERGASLLILESADVGRARADVLAAKSRYQQSEAELGRERRLFDGGASTERSVMTVETDHSVAEFGLRAAEERLRILGAAGGRSSAVPLQTPLAGMVLEVKARMGQPVGPSDTLVVVGDIDGVWLGVDVYERDLAKVHLGDEARVTTVAFPDRIFVGKVEQLGTMIDPDRKALEARIVLPNADRALRPGMTATARILGAGIGDGGTTVVVPRSAIQAIDGQPFVFVEKSPGKYELRAIERGNDVESEVEVRRGLAEGEPIVVDGAFVLKSEVLKSQMGTND